MMQKRTEVRNIQMIGPNNHGKVMNQTENQAEISKGMMMAQDMIDLISINQEIEDHLIEKDTGHNLR